MNYLIRGKVIPTHSKKTVKEVAEAAFLSSLTSALDGGQWSSAPRWLNSGEGTAVPSECEAGCVPEIAWAVLGEQKIFRLCRDSIPACPFRDLLSIRIAYEVIR